MVKVTTACKIMCAPPPVPRLFSRSTFVSHRDPNMAYPPPPPYPQPTHGTSKDALAARHPKNPLLQVRGNAGTHDLTLGLDTIRALKQQRPGQTAGREAVGGEEATTKAAATAEAGDMIARIPRYDKSAGGGRGDRAPPEDWVDVSTPPAVVLLEGWMLGFEPLPEDSPVLAAADQGERCCQGCGYGLWFGWGRGG